jgi:hypothetical protein
MPSLCVISRPTLHRCCARARLRLRLPSESARPALVVGGTIGSEAFQLLDLTQFPHLRLSRASRIKRLHCLVTFEHRKHAIADVTKSTRKLPAGHAGGAEGGNHMRKILTF